jgi:charged multivesicular body protein 6
LVYFTNITSKIDSIEFAQIEQKVIDGLKQGNDVLKELHAQMSLEDIDNLMLDTQEAIERQNQIEEALSGVLSSADEEDIMAELEALDTGVMFTIL